LLGKIASHHPIERRTPLFVPSRCGETVLLSSRTMPIDDL
jgi:hypothetical protein